MASRENGTEGSGHIWSGRVPRTSGSTLRPGPTHFWQRRTGSGSRKLDLTTAGALSTEEALSVSSHHSVMDDTVQEEDEGTDSQTKASAEHLTKDSSHPHYHTRHLRTMLARQHVDEHLFPQDLDGTVLGTAHSHVHFTPPSSVDPLKPNLSADDVDTIRSRPRRSRESDWERLNVPTYYSQEAVVGTPEGRLPATMDAWPPERPSAPAPEKPSTVDLGSDSVLTTQVARTKEDIPRRLSLPPRREASPIPQVTLADAEAEER